jgi:hypothetical protein
MFRDKEFRFNYAESIHQFYRRLITAEKHFKAKTPE